MEGDSVYSRDRLSATCCEVHEELRPLIHRRYGRLSTLRCLRFNARSSGSGRPRVVRRL